MEADLTQDSPDAESEDPLSASPEESASQPDEADLTSALEAQMNALLRGQIDRVTAGSTSKPGDADDEDDDTAGDGVSASSEDVKPSDTAGKPLGRRAAAAEIQRLADENARLRQAWEAANPRPPDPSETARVAAVEREQRFRRLLLKPDTDPDWSTDDWQFVQDEKTKRSVAPELAQHYQMILDQDLAAHEQAYAGKHKAFEGYVLEGMAAVKDLPGVDFEAIKAAPDFRAREQLIYRAGAASHEPELKRLREENAELRRDLLGSTRAPVGAGRSSPGRTVDPDTLMNTLLRGGYR